MKRVLFILLGVVVIVFSYAGVRSGVVNTEIKLEKKSCTGYEVIEAGKGINCHGDTIKLARKSGYYEVAVNNTAE